jgi:hypothetical protein
MYALAACNDIGARRLVEMMDENEIANLGELAEFIIAPSRAAMLAAIGELPQRSGTGGRPPHGLGALPAAAGCGAAGTSTDQTIGFARPSRLF